MENMNYFIDKKKTNFELVKEFHKTFSKEPDPEVPTVPDDKTRYLRARLIIEEMIESMDEMGLYLFDKHINFGDNKTVNLPNLAKELADILYVVYGAAAVYGIPIDDVYREVHRSNMSKLGDDGKPEYREDGKVLKSKNYQPPDIEAVLRKCQ